MISDIWPNLFSWIAVLLVCPLFLFRSTAILAVILNSFLAYLGIIMMADFSLSATLAGQVKVMPGVSFFGWLLQTTFSGYHHPGGPPPGGPGPVSGDHDGEVSCVSRKTTSYSNLQAILKPVWRYCHSERSEESRIFRYLSSFGSFKVLR